MSKKYSTTDNFFFTKLYREDKRYFWGFLIFFVLLVAIPAFVHRGIPPLFRGWGLFKDKQYIQPSYANIKIVVNDDTSCNVLQTLTDFGQLAFYVDFVQTKTDNQRYPYHKAVDLIFPGYASQQINFLSDTLAFQQWYKHSLSGLMHISVKKVSVYKENIVYNKDGYVVIQSTDLLNEF